LHHHGQCAGLVQILSCKKSCLPDWDSRPNLCPSL
jgi:hypothetical protein